MPAFVDTIAYRGETPWHGLGTEMTGTEALDVWTREAGLDFTVRPTRVLFDDGTGHQRAFAGKVVLHRADTGHGLGVVSDRYKIVQPGETIEFYRDFVRAGDMELEVGGTLLGGRRVWALARLPAEIRLPGNDVTRPYFLLTTSYDGETATIGTFTTVRVVCWNTLNIAYREREADEAEKVVSGFSVPHYAKFDIDVAKRRATELMAAARQYEEDANLLAATGVSEEQAQKYFLSLFGVVSQKTRQLTPQSRKNVDQLLRLYREGPGAELESAKGTAFGLLQAVTRYVDHEARERQAGGRLLSAWYGPGRNVKAEAVAAARELVAVAA